MRRPTPATRAHRLRACALRVFGSDPHVMLMTGQDSGLEVAQNMLPMRMRAFIACSCIAAAACAPTQPMRESPEYAARMRAAGEAYTACVSRESENDMKNPAGAEDIALAAHARCWSEWERYRAATRASFLYGARTADERQFASDKAEAHLRGFEQETRRSVIDAVAQRSLAPRP